MNCSLHVRKYASHRRASTSRWLRSMPAGSANRNVAFGTPSLLHVSRYLRAIATDQLPFPGRRRPPPFFVRSLSLRRPSPAGLRLLFRRIGGCAASVPTPSPSPAIAIAKPSPSQFTDSFFITFFLCLRSCSWTLLS